MGLNQETKEYQMIRSYTTFQAAAMILLAVSAYAAKPPSCTNPRVKWEFKSVDVIAGLPSRITASSQTPPEGVINICSGSGDATIETSVTFNFGPNLSGAPISPVTGSTFFNLRNIVFEHQAGGRLTEYEFTTWLGSGLPSPKKATWNFRMFNPDTDFTPNPLITSQAEVDITNTPLVTAAVIVHHCPAGQTSAQCGTPAKETWLVYPDPSQTTYRVGGALSPFRNVGALVDSSKNPLLNLGQFEMPFYFVISLL
jgi:hypothetical protein